MSPEVDKIMANRKKNGPLMSKWSPIKGKHKALSNRSIFKDDPEPSIKQYDDSVNSYADGIEEKKKLQEVLNTFSTNWDKTLAEVNKLKAERDKSEEDQAFNRDWDQLDKARKDPNPDPDKVVASLNSLTTSVQKAYDLHKRVMDQIMSTSAGLNGLTKQARDDYKARADKLNATLQKCYDDSDKAQDKIRAVISGFMDTADEIENNDLKKQLQAFYNLTNM